MQAKNDCYVRMAFLKTDNRAGNNIPSYQFRDTALGNHSSVLGSI